MEAKHASRSCAIVPAHPHPRVELPEKTVRRALVPLQRMLALN